MASKPLVSIGVPTCNRASMLERCLKSLVAQDYPNFEIVISDNASTDNTPEVCTRMQEQYPFIVYHRTLVRVSAFENFRKVLLLSKGYYFMWAADDDLWDPTFISTLVGYLESDDNLALIASEAQYMLSDGTMLPYFPEGKAFYKAVTHSRLHRLLMIAVHNYGNLIYGLYRREVLLTQEGGTILDFLKFNNEIPIFIYVAARGTIQVCSKVLFYKTTSLPTYLQAAREYGFRPVLDQQHLAALARGTTLTRSTLPNKGCFAKLGKLLRSTKIFWRSYRYSAGVFLYHIRTLADIRRAIWHIDINFAIKLTLLIIFTVRLTAHFLKLAVVWQVQDVIRNRM